MRRWIWRGSNYLKFWLLLDVCYVVALFVVPAFRLLPLIVQTFYRPINSFGVGNIQEIY